jgi:hypothetical protein
VLSEFSTSAFSCEQVWEAIIGGKERNREDAMQEWDWPKHFYAPYIAVHQKEAWPDDWPVVCETSDEDDNLRKFGADVGTDKYSIREFEIRCILHLKHLLVARAAADNPVRVIFLELALACAPLALRPQYVADLRVLCDDFHVTLVVDEVFTRWRCGALFMSTSKWYTDILPKKCGGARVRVADMIVAGKMGMGLVLMHSDCKGSCRAPHVDNMTINGRGGHPRETPMLRGVVAEQFLREYALLCAKGKLSDQGLRETALAAGQTLARRICSDVKAQQLRSKQTKSVQVVGLGAHIFCSKLLHIHKAVDAGIKHAFSMQKRTNVDTEVSSK